MEFHAFVVARLGPAPVRVLEVGCGSAGGVTPALLAAGHDVLAIDPHAPAGAPYRAVRLEELDGEDGFDAVVAGRVIHHLEPLDAAVDRLAAHAPLLLADEFAHDRLDEPTGAWYERRHAELTAAGETPLGPPSLDAWRERHPGLHGYETLRDAVTRRFALRELEWRPYFYRWLGPAELAEEAALIDAGAIRPIGYRFVAERPT